jgi:hypothetical protein
VPRRRAGGSKLDFLEEADPLDRFERGRHRRRGSTEAFGILLGYHHRKLVALRDRGQRDDVPFDSITYVAGHGVGQAFLDVDDE